MGREVFHESLKYEKCQQKSTTYPLVIADLRGNEDLNDESLNTETMNMNSRAGNLPLPVLWKCEYCDRTFDVLNHYFSHLLREHMEIKDRDNDADGRHKSSVISFIRYRIQTVIKQRENRTDWKMNKKLKKLIHLRGHEVSIYKPEMKTEKCPICERRYHILEDCWQHLFAQHLCSEGSVNASHMMVIIESLLQKYGNQLLGRKFQCKYGCDWKSYSKHELKLHHLQEARKRIDPSPILVCKFCNFAAYQSRENLIHHFRSKHNGLCPVCENFVLNDSQKNEHIDCRPRQAQISTDCWFMTCELCTDPRPKILITELDRHILEKHLYGST